MQTGYIEDATKPQRPPLTTWPSGFFIEDFTYKNKEGDIVLDENNGRHCVTPDFPNGTYAYFATIATDESDTQSPFTGFRRPKFPYLIGENYHAKPNTFNFKKVANQDEFDFNNSNYIKNTSPFNYIDGKSTRYKYVSLPSDLTQEVEVSNATRGQSILLELSLEETIIRLMTQLYSMKQIQVVEAFLQGSHVSWEDLLKV